MNSALTPLARSRLTGRPVPAGSAVAVLETVSPPVLAAAPSQPDRVPAGLGRILRPQAQQRWILPQLSAITPTYIESVLRGAFTGGQLQQWELFDLMEDTWPRLAKNLNEIKRAVAQMDWKLEPWAEEDQPPTDSAKERARVVSNAVWKMRPDPCADENGFRQTILDLLDAWGKGLSVLEIDWQIREAGPLGDITAPRCTHWVHPVNYAWSNEGRLGLRDPNDPRTGRAALPTTSGQPGRNELAEFPPDKFLIAIARAKSGTAMTSALLRPLAWWWCAANFSADWLMNLAQVFGLPFRWANYAQGAAQSTINAVSDMLENMGSAGWAAFPEGTTLELKEASRTGDASPQADLIDRADKQCDLLVLGQTLTSDSGGMGQGGGSLALGRVHEGVKGEVVEAAAGFVAEVLNAQLIPSILRLNYGDEEEGPEFCPEPKTIEDGKLNADRDAVLIASGIEMPKDWFYKRHNIPLPQEGEDVIGKPEPAPTFGNDRFGNPQPPAKMEKPGAEEEDEEATETEREPAAAKAAPARPRLQTTALEEFSRSLASDLQPVRARLAAILQISDPQLLAQKLAVFRDDMERLKRDILQDPAAAHALEKIISAELANGMAQTNPS